MDDLEFIDFRSSIVKDGPLDVSELIKRVGAALNNPEIPEVYKLMLKNDKTIARFIELGLVEVA
jgi:hypothetical protein